MADPLRIVLPLPFHEAIRAATRREVVLPNAYYGDIQGAARSQAFSVAGLASVDQLQNVLDTLNEGLRSGLSFGEWRDTAAEQDWNLPDHRLDLIMRMHTQTAYQAGHWEQFDRLAERRGFLMYSAINDSRTRPAHRAMDGIVKPLGDSFWDDHSPPCGYNCRCSLVSLTQDQVDARGGETSEIPAEARADPGFGSKPEIGLHMLDERIGSAMVEAPGSLGDQFRAWYLEIANEKIVERVQRYVPSYDAIAKQVRPFIEEMDGLVMEHEAVALNYYTRSGYGPINAVLRKMEVGTDDAQATAAAAWAATLKMPAYEGTVYRGIYSEGLQDVARFFERHQPGEVVEYQGFTSSSYTTGFNGDIQYEIRSVNGRVVEGLAADPFENEVVFMPGTRFRVVTVEGEHPVRITLQELEDQNVTVPDANKFAADDGGKDGPKGKVSEALQARAQAEARFLDPAALAKFRSEHDGMTPLEVLIARFPSLRMEIAQHAPQMLPKKPKA